MRPAGLVEREAEPAARRRARRVERVAACVARGEAARIDEETLVRRHEVRPHDRDLVGAVLVRDAHLVGRGERVVLRPGDAEQRQPGTEQRVRDLVDRGELDDLRGPARDRVAERRRGRDDRPVLQAGRPLRVGGSVARIDDLEGDPVARREPRVAERVGGLRPHEHALGRAGGQAARALAPVVDRDLAERVPGRHRLVGGEGERRAVGVAGDVPCGDRDASGRRRDGDMDEGARRHRLAELVVDEARVAAHRRAAARSLEVRLGRDPVEAVVEQVADVCEQLEHRDRRVGAGQVGVRMLAQQVLGERLPERAPVAREVVVHGRRRRRSRRGRHREAGAERVAVGAQAHGQERAQRIEVDRRRLDDLEPVERRVRRAVERQLEVRRRCRLDRDRVDDRDGARATARRQGPQGGVGERGRRVLVQPDVEEEVPARAPHLRGTEPLHGRAGREQRLWPVQRRAGRLQRRGVRHSSAPPAAAVRRRAGACR